MITWAELVIDPRFAVEQDFDPENLALLTCLRALHGVEKTPTRSSPQEAAPEKLITCIQIMAGRFDKR